MRTWQVKSVVCGGCNQSALVIGVVVELRDEVGHLIVLNVGSRKLGVPKAQSERHIRTHLPRVVGVKLCITPAAQRCARSFDLGIVCERQSSIQQVSDAAPGLRIAPSDEGGCVASSGASGLFVLAVVTV